MPRSGPRILPRGFTYGAGVELFGIAVTILGLAAGSVSYWSGVPVYTPNASVAYFGAFIALLGLVMHSARLSRP